MNAVVIGQPLVPHYQWMGVAISYVVAVLGSFAALQCARHMFDKQGKLDWAMGISAAIALGGIGIWSMHFIGMLAYRPGVPVSYEIVPTVLSLIAAIVISGLALFLAGRKGRFTVGGWVAGSVLAGLGVCVMHYMGMYAMNMRASMTWDMAIIGISVAIAIGAAGAALWLAFNLDRLWLQIAAAFVMGVAVCAMHYTGMSSVSLICTAQAAPGLWLVSNAYLDVVVFVTALLALVQIYWVLSGRNIRRGQSGQGGRRVMAQASARR
jgi:NO-binding membrane sensor protein with MHYT domain